MEEKIEIKRSLLKECLHQVAVKYETVSQIIRSNKKALESETKSSAGDKHETGRAVLQLEMEKASQQFAVVEKMQETLKRISPEKLQETVALGSVVITSGFNYYIAVSLGELSIGKDQYYAISPQSPIGSLLMGKKSGDLINFNGKEISILEVF
jgi:transcription elongation GreA/GreB family factor